MSKLLSMAGQAFSQCFSCWHMLQHTFWSPRPKTRGIVGAEVVDKMLLNASDVNTELRELIPKVKVRDLPACVQAVTLVHALPTLAEAKNPQETNVAEMHRVLKRFVNDQFIERVFANETCMTKDAITAHLELFWDKENVEKIKQALFKSWQATGRTFEDDPEKKPKRVRPPRRRCKKRQNAEEEHGEPTLEPATRQPLFEIGEDPMYIQIEMRDEPVFS